MAARTSEIPRPVRANGEDQVGLLIGGKVIETSDVFAIYDPAAPHDVVGYAASATAAHAIEAIDAAHAAWKEWSRLAPETRAAYVIGALDALDDDHQERVDLLVRENGKVRPEADVELGVFAWRCELAAGLAPELKKVRDFPPLAERPNVELARSGEHPRMRRFTAPPFRSTVTAMPLGVVTIIVPYNWPIAIVAASLPYALVAGNTVVVKPPPTSPLCLMQTLELVASRLPPGVLNVVSGTHEAVAPLLEDPRVRHVVFTGSTATGKHIMRAAAENVTGVTLELGGNDPAIVLDDAELDEATIQRLVSACFMTSGQVCMGVKRIYVHRSRAGELAEGMADVLAHYRVGHGLARDSTMGPLNNPHQRDFVQALCEEARASGAEVRELGAISDECTGSGGYFLRPALVIDPRPDLGIVTEEQFGPAVPILPFDDVDPLLEHLNEEWAGLCSSVWTSDPERAADLASRLRTGTTWVNNANAVAQDDRAPFGGFRASGIGRELGIDGLLALTEPHTITYPG